MPQGEDQGYNLSLTDENNGNKYLYHGGQQPSASAILIYNSASGSFALDRMDSEFRFNLRSTPTNDDAAALATQYSQLDTGLQETNVDDEDMFNEGAEGHDPTGEPPNPNNPYDYRHFLNSSRIDRSPSPAPSRLPSPMPNGNIGSSPIVTGASSNRQSQPPKLNRRRSHPKPRPLSPNPRDETDADNEASEADDVLTIDMGESVPTQSRPWRAALGALNEGGRSSGPISLRSAASSMSPSVHADSDVEAENGSDGVIEEIDLGNGEEEAGSREADAEEVETPGMLSEEDENPFAMQLETQLMAEALSEAEQEEPGGAEVNGSYTQSNGMNGVTVHGVEEESSEESEEE